MTEHTYPDRYPPEPRGCPTPGACSAVKEIERLRAHLRALAEAVVDSVSSCDGVVSIEADHQARLALEEVDQPAVRERLGVPLTSAKEHPSITCPRCGFTSYHPRDIAEGYCGRCHDWTRIPSRKPDR